MKVFPFALAGLAAFGVLGSEANATFYCNGTTSETTDPTGPWSSTINGHTVPSVKEIPSVGLGTGGEAYRGNHRSCGMITVYMYTGTDPSDYFEVDVDLNPSIVEDDVAQAKCTATIETTAPIYANGTGGPGVPAGNWFYQHPVTLYFDDAYGYIGSESPPRRHVWLVGIYTGHNLDANSVYNVNIDCPTNVPNGG